MNQSKLAYLFHVSVRRVFKKKKLFLLLLFSMAAAMIVPLFGVTLAEALVRQKNGVRERYSQNAWAYRADLQPIGEYVLSRIRDSLCDAGVTAQIYGEYVLTDPDSPAPTGRFLDVNAADAVSLSLFFPEISPGIAEAFAQSRPVCVIDDQTARTCSLGTGDTLSVRGEIYEIVSVAENQSSRFVCIPYGRLSPGTVYAHTVYLLFDREETKASVRSAMKTLLPEAENGTAVPLTESYNTKKSNADSTLLLVIAVTVLYLFVAVTNITLIRYGDMRVHLHDYAVSLALGCTKAELLCQVLFENLILTPAAFFCDIGLFLLLARTMPFFLTLSPVSVLCVFLMAFLTALAAAAAVTNRLTKQSCVSMLKEG